MFRKSALAMAVVGTLSAGTAVALGLGEIELKSALNQPLDAEVELLSATREELEELKVEVASPEAFARAGIERPLFLNKLQFDVTTNADGKPVLHISSRDVVREPFLDFLLELSWSKGKLVREYTVLVDPPLTMPAPAPALQVPAARAALRPAPATPSSRVTHAAKLPPVSAAPTEYTTQRNDTLWHIAQQVRPDADVSIEQTMLGLLRANPEAFIDNNINNLKAGYVLRVPDREELTRMSQAEALRETRRQYAEWRQARDLAAASESPVAPSGTATAADVPDASLELVAPDLSEAGVDGGSGEAVPDLKALQNELMIANEALEAQRRQSEEMATRMSVLEEQIQNMQRLIQLKDDELARLQAQVGDELGQPQEGGNELSTAGEAADSANADAVASAVTGEEMADGAAAAADQMGQEDVSEPTVVAGAPEDTAVVPPLAAVSVDEGLGEGFAGVDPGVTEEAIEPPVDLGEPQEAGEIETGAETEMFVEPAVAAEPPAAETFTSPGLVDRLLANPLWLGAGATVLLLAAFLGLRRKRDGDPEFQESILQAAQEKSSASSDEEAASAASASAHSSAAASSLLSEFAVSDMGAMKSDGEADPLAEADVYLAYGRYQQAEDLIKDALAASPEQPELELKLLEIYLAASNQAAFDEHAQRVFDRLDGGDDPVWEKIAEMGREISPDNPLYQQGTVLDAVTDEEDRTETLTVVMDTDADAAAAAEDTRTDEEAGSAVELGMGGEFDFDEAEEDLLKPDSAEFTPPEVVSDGPEVPGPVLEASMDSIEPDRIQVEQDNTLEFDLEGFDLGGEEEADLPGDGELADLDEVSTKLDLARAYLDMGDPEGARTILDEVIEEGSDDQRSEAEQILAKIA
ncbi:MAG: FimV/HubP family polar landmark protein [Gammaproteobacteria bacterium]|jgi:pilus assembly protein FimV